MPGIPRTTYCQPCKRRRTKCDQNWPTCSACRRAKIDCPGPSTTVKFVHNGNHAVNKDAGAGIASSSTSTNLQIVQASGSSTRSINNNNGRIMLVRPGRKTKAGQNGPAFASFRLVDLSSSMALSAMPPATPSDRVAAQLITLIDSSTESLSMATLVLGRFRNIPVRLPESTCLRDAAAYRCSRWIDQYQGLRDASVDTMKLYGKVLRSLQDALNGPKALSAETFAATTILRLESQNEHIHGVIMMMSKMGPPNLEDSLEVDMTAQNFNALKMYEANHGDIEFLKTPGWKDALEEVARLTSDQEDEMALLLRRCKHRWASWLRDAKSIANDPDSFEEAARSLESEFLDTLAEFESLEAEYWEYINEDDEIREVFDPESLAGTRYDIDDLMPAVLLFEPLYDELLMSRHLSNFAAWYNWPSMEMMVSKHRAISIRAWKLIPYLETQKPQEVYFFSTLYYLSYEGATEDEKEQLLEFIRFLESTREDPSKSTAEWADEIILMAKLFTGRAELPES